LTLQRRWSIFLRVKNEREFRQFEVSEVYCPTCQTAKPVRRHLLLVLPTGNKYEYRCTVCGTPLGGKDDGDASEYNAVLNRTSRLIGGR
jgi:hypothetical protein